MGDILDRIDAGAETIGAALGYDDEPTATPCLPPITEGGATFPVPGLYFGMSDDAYHAIHACSATGLKRMAASSMDYWATSCLNPALAEDDGSAAKHLGRAYHKRILEGAEAYAAAYAVAPERADFDPAALIVTVEQIKERLAALKIKPVGRRKDDWIAQLLDADPSALVWDAIVAAHREANAGRTFVSARDDQRIAIAARMIECHDELRTAFTGGWPEVSAFWFCPTTGAPMKARFDYLKMRAIVDLKSFSNASGKPVNRAIETAIAAYRYNVQHVVYLDAARAMRALIRAHGASAIATDPFGDVRKNAAATEWAMRWAMQEADPAFLFVFQQTGVAPVTRGRLMPTGTVYSVTRSRVRMLKERWVQCARTYGTDPWLDIEPIDQIEDESIPLYATEI